MVKNILAKINMQKMSYASYIRIFVYYSNWRTVAKDNNNIHIHIQIYRLILESTSKAAPPVGLGFVYRTIRMMYELYERKNRLA